MATIQDFRTTIAVTIATGESLSTGYDLGGYRVAAIINPSSWTTASLTFAGGVSSGATFYSVHGTTGDELAVTTTGLQCHGLDSDTSLGISACRWLKVRSGVKGTEVTQSSQVTFTLVLA